MIGTMTLEQSEQVLRSGLIGRIGCNDGKRTYIVPVTYVFDAKFIYAHSREGMKIEIMRKNPSVCFEVESIESMTNWRCVIVTGIFHELKTEKTQADALDILKDRLAPYLLSETMRPHIPNLQEKHIEKERKPVVYRIEITEISGRFEKNIYPGNLPK